jgi:hypothetical protein
MKKLFLAAALMIFLAGLSYGGGTQIETANGLPVLKTVGELRSLVGQTGAQSIVVQGGREGVGRSLIVVQGGREGIVVQGGNIKGVIILGGRRFKTANYPYLVNCVENTPANVQFLKSVGNCVFENALESAFSLLQTGRNVIGIAGDRIAIFTKS